MRIFESQLRILIRESLLSAIREKKEKWMGDVSRDIEDKGHEGIFTKWCKDQGFEGVNQSCVDKAYGVGKPWKKRASLAVTYSQGKGGAPSLRRPKTKK